MTKMENQLTYKEDKSMLVTNIEWDTDEEEWEDDDDLDLPTEVEVPDDIDPDDIADWLSDKYEFFVRSFRRLGEE